MRRKLKELEDRFGFPVFLLYICTKTIDSMEKQEELWKPVVGYEGLYMVSNLGRVKSLPREGTKGCILKPSSDKWGYPHVCLCKNGEQKSCRVHILVMRAFIGKCPDGYEVDHENWNIVDNRLENLSYQPKEVNRARHNPEWQKNNAEANRRKAKDPEWKRKNAEAAKKRAKPVDQYTLDGQFVRKWESIMDVERELGIDNRNISSCCSGKRKTTGGFVWRYA